MTIIHITVTSLNKNILIFLEKILMRFGFSPTRDFQENIYISNKRDIAHYFEITGANKPKLEKKLKIV
jgi:hypothetical protein